MRPAVAPFIVLALVACTQITGVDDPLARELPLPEDALSGARSARRVAAIDTQAFTLPTRARAGVATELVIPVAAGGCYGEDTTVVNIVALTATIVPYERAAPTTSICPALYFVDQRRVQLTFASPGAARVRLLVRNGPEGALMYLDRGVTVE